MSEELRPIEPVRLKMLNGEEKRFLLSMGGIKRLKQRFEVKTIKEILDKDVEEAGVPILFEAMLDRGELTEKQFSEMLPGHIGTVTKALLEIIGVSFEKEVPTVEASAAASTAETPSIQ